ncbi:hypothetical protein ETD86_27260 [Nonomuraea turkmeniaca]|uniref:ABC transporter permease n=1 Tax=Nonomuraea turkmeniaca TaxID=103838 RepID=A0A5S4FWV5_9ACTN|nr:hypothetical protein ETD86_27260 [Nonomuraea turkmeniaca]
MFGQLIIGVLGVLSITSEYATGTIRASLAAVPRRGRLFAAKAVVVGLVTTVAGLATAFSSFLTGQWGFATSGVPHAGYRRSGGGADPARGRALPGADRAARPDAGIPDQIDSRRRHPAHLADHSRPGHTATSAAAGCEPLADHCRYAGRRDASPLIALARLPAVHRLHRRAHRRRPPDVLSQRHVRASTSIGMKVPLRGPVGG